MNQSARMLIKVLPLLWVLVVLTSSAVSADGFDQLRKDAARIKTISADFAQKKSLKILAKPLISEGRFFYAAPDALRWEYLKPLKSLVLSSNGATRRFLMSGGKMVEDTTGSAAAMKIVLDEVAVWMSGRFDANPSFRATLSEGAQTTIELVPQEKGLADMMQKIEIVVSRKDAAIRSVTIVESASAQTRIDFTNVVINAEIDPSVFRDVK